MRTPARATVLGLAAVLAVVCLAYANHFGNSFHFDDSHTIKENPYIRDLGNIPRFFTDAGTFSALPANRSWRPLVPTSLAIDYWLAGGLEDPTWFHVSTFFWFLVQLVLIFALFEKVMDLAAPDPANRRVALLATALYGLHPAMAETVNYVIQRGDVYSTLGVIAALVIYAYLPERRRQGWYLVALTLALLSKPPALVFPAILFAYLTVIERERPARALVHTLPAIALVVAYGLLARAMTPASYVPTATAAAAYRMTQPLVALRYFGTFFLPTNLSADSDLRAVSSLLQDGAWLGVLFVLAMVAVAVRSSRRDELRPLAFGLYWYLIALLPTALFPLAEVENDHRMFFPFVGLTLAVCWTGALWLRRHPLPRPLVAAVCAAVLVAAALGTRQRNEVWHTEESLWYDVTLKSPRNGRGLMNYGLTQMKVGRYHRALDYFTRALEFNPNYAVLEINLGVVNGALGNDADAERHFRRAIELAPADAWARYFFAKWLRDSDRRTEAVANLEVAVEANPDYMEAQHLLMTTLAELNDRARLRQVAQAAVERFPSDGVAQAWLAGNAPPTRPATPESLLDESLSLYRRGKYEDSIAAARHALDLRPEYAEAWNNVCAAYNSMSRWEEGIRACKEALRLKPDYQLASNNLAWALSRQGKSQTAGH